MIGYGLDHIVDSKKHRRFSLILMLAWPVLLTASLIFVAFENSQTEKSERELSSNVETLTKRTTGLDSTVDSLTKLLTPLTAVATQKFPDLDTVSALTALAESLAEVKTEIWESKPRLIFLEDKMTFHHDTVSDSWIAQYCFQPSHSSLSNVSIHMRFVDVVDQITYDWLSAAMVWDQGTRILKDSDNKGFSLETGVIQLGNTLVIQVQAKSKPLFVSFPTLSP